MLRFEEEVPIRVHSKKDSPHLLQLHCLAEEKTVCVHPSSFVLQL